MHRRTTGSQPLLQHRWYTLTQQITLHYISTAWDTTCGHKAKDITPSIAWRREAWKEEVLDDLLSKDERGPSSVRWTLEPFQRWCWENFWETGWSAQIPSWTELSTAPSQEHVTPPITWRKKTAKRGNALSFVESMTKGPLRVLLKARQKAITISVNKIFWGKECIWVSLST